MEFNPNDVASRMGLAQAHIEGEQWRDAIEHLDKVVTDEPKNPQAPPLLARCYLSLGEVEKVPRRAQREYGRACSLLTARCAVACRRI
eukprot:COSAG01_NODE_22730_length_843_cov_5.611559_1_plen_87_part_10